MTDSLTHINLGTALTIMFVKNGLARQKVNYHPRALEEHGLVQLAQERKWGGLTECSLIATAASYFVSPNALDPVAIDPNRETRVEISRRIRPGGCAIVSW